MSFADSKFLPSGAYAIINVEYNRSIAFSEQEECLSTSGDDYEWTITFLANKKWTIQGPSDVFVDIPPDSESGEDVSSVESPFKPHQWVIKRHSGDAQSYIIYSPTRPELFWTLPNADEGTAPQLDVDHTSRPSLWKFKKIQKSVAEPDPMKLFVAAPVQRPTQLDSAIKNTFALTIPAGWLTTITSVSCGNSVNLVRVRRVVNGALEKQELVSGWDAIDKTMTVDGSDSNSVALLSVEEAYVLVVEAFHSGNRARKDPRSIPFFVSSSLTYCKLEIFDESLDASGSGRTQNAIITIHTSAKVAVDLEDPGKPEPVIWINGWSEVTFLVVISTVDITFTNRKYRAVFVVDDSSAAPEEVVQVFDQIEPKGPSPIGARLEFLLGEIIDQLEQAKHNAADYGQVKPINIIVLTSSRPSDNPTNVIRSAVRKLNEGLHHSNAVAIQFAQIGNDNHVETALKKLSDDPSLNIVDTASFGRQFTP
ncbi:hypothetical protein B0H14DRAFT_3740925 [Mycena olivaceomarginata]|nr:hypothetical protein B0H14DRAFT_3740925 [Mycena olivaceomarginata]